MVIERRQAVDFIVSDVRNLADYSDRGICVTLLDRGGASIRLHLNTEMGELLCARIADALECRYGKDSSSASGH